MDPIIFIFAVLIPRGSVHSSVPCTGGIQLTAEKSLDREKSILVVPMMPACLIRQQGMHHQIHIGRNVVPVVHTTRYRTDRQSTRAIQHCHNAQSIVPAVAPWQGYTPPHCPSDHLFSITDGIDTWKLITT